MKKLIRRRARTFPLMMAELAMASWETIARRTSMIARGTCSPAEYQRMIIEKAAALQQSAVAAMTGRATKPRSAHGINAPQQMRGGCAGRAD